MSCDDINQTISMQIDSNDVIKLMLQFCKENNFHKTYHALQEETDVKFNAVESINLFSSDILNGKWDQVLKTIRNFDVPILTIMTLYEQIIIELIENKDHEVAALFLNENNETITKLRLELPERFGNLENLVKNKNIDVNEIYKKNNTTKEKVRNTINNLLQSEICISQPSRLLYLLGLALKQLCPNDSFSKNSYNIFNGSYKNITIKDSPSSNERVTKVDKKIMLGEKSYIEIAKFSFDGNYLATGSIDGFIEIWDPLSGKLKGDLNYQLENNLLIHVDSVLALNFSRDSKMLCSADASGNIKIWKIQNGKCLREYTDAHSKGITCISFNKDNSIVISGSFDCSVKVFGLKSGKQIKELQGHSSFINDIGINTEGDKLITASADSSIKVWDLRNYELLNTISLPVLSHVKEIGINNISLYPKNNDFLFACNKSQQIHLISVEGEVIKSFSGNGKKNFVYCTSSNLGDYLYAVDEDHILFIIEVSSTKIVNYFKIHEKDVIGLVHHPLKNILVSYSLDGVVNILN
jgi:WD40 repeat-containing protein SMU1